MAGLANLGLGGAASLFLRVAKARPSSRRTEAPGGQPGEGALGARGQRARMQAGRFGLGSPDPGSQPCGLGESFTLFYAL